MPTVRDFWRKDDGNLELSVYRTAFKQLEETVSLGYQEEMRQACRKDLPLAAIMLRGLDMPAGSVNSETLSLRGYEPYCPAGGKYVLDSTTGDVSCTLHGTLYRLLFFTAALLFCLTFFLNTAAELVRQQLRKRYESF